MKLNLIGQNRPSQTRISFVEKAGMKKIVKKKIHLIEKPGKPSKAGGFLSSRFNQQ